MQTIKTGIVVALLLAVCYGAFVAMNAPDAELPSELEEWAKDGQLDGLMVDIEIPSQVGGGSSTADMGSSAGTAFPSVSLPNTLPSVSVPVSLPSSQVPELPKFDIEATPISSKNTPTTPAVTPGEDGPSVKLPVATTDSELNSLVVDPSPSQTKASLIGAEYPAIPLADPKLADPKNGLKESQQAVLAADVASQPTLPPFSAAREQALKQANNGDLKGALVALSAYYSSPELPHTEHSDLLEILDALAREVIYSQRHLVAPAYVATAGETIASVAAKHHVTAELLSSINHLQDANVLIQDQQIKVIEGPMRGEVDLTRSELTVFLKDMYAGRFPITIGEDPAPRTGHFEVADKRRDRNYYGAGGKLIRADDPQNPYGGFWIDLGLDMCIHGSAEMATTELKSAGCISLSPIDAADIYNMLTLGSQIDIRK